MMRPYRAGDGSQAGDNGKENSECLGHVELQSEMPGSPIPMARSHI